jgi:hypothetical protein
MVVGVGPRLFLDVNINAMDAGRIVIQVCRS